jgi:hypothetical protein
MTYISKWMHKKCNKGSLEALQWCKEISKNKISKNNEGTENSLYQKIKRKNASFYNKRPSLNSIKAVSSKCLQG